MEQAAVDQFGEKIFKLLGERLGVRGRTLEARYRKAGRLVPKRARQPIKTLIEAQQMAANPTLAIRVDEAAVTQAYNQATMALNEVDRAATRSQKRFNLAALILLQILIVAGLFFAVLRWRGFL